MYPTVPQKLIVMIVADIDGERLLHKLVTQGYPATKISSTGGFLRRGNATILSVVEENDVEPVLATVRAECHARTEYLPVQALPFIGNGTFLTDPVEVRVGGAIVFVLPVERFEKT
ncbi:MAG TPA: cyclic-di-AMP receptor [Chthonomonadales bacterium]|nr:cyclic-di-AMP receptor [Chthonomonadales bacterium]